MHFSSRRVPRRQNSPPSFLGLPASRNVCSHTGTDLEDQRAHVLHRYKHIHMIFYPPISYANKLTMYTSKEVSYLLIIS